MKALAQPLTRNPISNSGGIRHCKDFEKEIRKTTIVDLGTANGLQMLWFTWVNPVVALREVDTQQVIGYMELDKADPAWGLKYRYYQAGVFIVPKYRKRGLGTVLYLGALHAFDHLISDPIIGIDAVRTWKSIEKYGYKVRMWDAEQHVGLNFTWAPDGQPLIAGLPMGAYESDLLFYV